MPRSRSAAAAATARACSMSSRAGSSASRFASAQPRYCVFASSSRSAPIRSASATNSLTRAMLPRWITTFSVSGRPSARDGGGDLQLAFEIVAPRDPRGAVRVDVLDRELHAVEAGRRQLGEPGAVGGNAAGDQIDVELLRVRRRDQRRPGPAAPAARRPSGSPAARPAPPRPRTRAATPRCPARRRAARDPADSSSTRTRAGSGTSAPRPACRAAAFHRPRSRHDQQAPIVERTEEA